MGGVRMMLWEGDAAWWAGDEDDGDEEDGDEDDCDENDGGG